MKLTKLTTLAAALAAAAVLTTSARAAGVSQTYTSGDLLLGFEQQNNSTDYVVNLGLASQFITAQSTDTPWTLQLSTTDLGNVFGSTTWSTNNNGSANVQWGIIGNDQGGAISGDSDANSIWLTQAETVKGTQSAAPAALQGSTLGSVSNEIQNFETGSGGFQHTTSTSDTTNAITQSTGNSHAWGNYGPGIYSPANAGTAFGYGSSIEQPGSGSNTGPTDSYLDLYQLNSSDAVGNPGAGEAVDLLGTFSLSSGGLLTFDPAAVPEPSAYALGLTALVLFTVLKRRKSIAVQG